MDDPDPTDPLHVGMRVSDAAGAKLGTVVVVTPERIVAEHGWFTPTDYFIPRAAIARVAGEEVWLRVTKAELPH